MNDSSFFAVLTTIQQPTPAVRSLVEALVQSDGRLIVAGDRKGPFSYELDGCDFLSLDAQLTLPYAISPLLPQGHYARKNVGYLRAIGAGATCVYETDDDNAPISRWFRRAQSVNAVPVTDAGWVNIYRHFSADRIWPRGFPLDAVVASCDVGVNVASESVAVQAPIQQGLANNSPDVDAVWRLVLDRPFDFDDAPSVFLPPGAWCPFNSQSTWWWPVAYPLMYLPSYCSFRMTDIWRSFIAQRCLWELGHGVVFHAAEVVQERNPHNLMRDFSDEIPGYQRNRELVDRLHGLALQKGTDSVGRNLRSCYVHLVGAGFFPESELALVDAWLMDLETR